MYRRRIPKCPQGYVREGIHAIEKLLSGTFFVERFKSEDQHTFHRQRQAESDNIITNTNENQLKSAFVLILISQTFLKDQKFSHPF